MATRQSKRDGKSVGPLAPNSEEEPMSKDMTQYVTPSEAAAIMGVDQNHVNLHLRRQKIRGIKKGWS